MSTATHISGICKNRGSRRDATNTRVAKLEAWSKKVDAIIKMGVYFQRIANGEVQLAKLIEVKEKSVSLKNAIDRALADKHGSIAICKNRLSRNYVNIGITAPWRHGKSLFLQSIFAMEPALAEYLIPVDSSQSEACTGTTVHYVNSQERKAVVSFFSEQEVFSSVVSLIEKLKADDKDLLYQDAFNDILGHNDLPSLVAAVKQSRYYISELAAPQISTFEATLKEYVDGYDNIGEHSYKTLLGEGAIDEIAFSGDLINTDNKNKLKKIYEYICFYQFGGNKNTHNNFRCLGVKEVTIYLPLKSGNEDLGNIRFVDTPGIGEKRTAIEENLRRILTTDIDLVIAICRTDKAKADDFNKFNEFLCEDFNVKYEGKDKKTTDATGCIFYIINCYDNKDMDSDIHQAVKNCIVDSLGRAKKPITLPPAQIGIFDVFNNKTVGIDEKRETTEVDSKTVYVRDQEKVEGNASINFLVHCLESIKDVDDMDAYFISKADEKIDELSGKYGELVGELSELHLEPRNHSIDNKILQKQISDAVRAIAPEYADDDSEQKIKEFLNKKDYAVVTEFLDAALDMPMGTTATAEDVLKKVSDSNLFLEQNVYDEDEHFSAYTEIHMKYKGYIHRCLGQCLNENEIINSQKRCGNAIINVFSRSLSPAFGAKEALPPTKFVELMRKELAGKPYGTSLLKTFDNLLNPQGCADALKDYHQRALSPSYHMQMKPDNDFPFEDVCSTRRTFCMWLINITRNLFEKIGAKEAGVPSFDNLLSGIKQAYRKDVLSPLGKINEINPLANDLLLFIDYHSDKIHDTEGTNCLIQEWNTLVNDTIDAFTM